MNFYGLQLLMLLVAGGSAYGQTMAPDLEDSVHVNAGMGIREATPDNGLNPFPVRMSLHFESGESKTGNSGLVLTTGIENAYGRINRANSRFVMMNAIDNPYGHAYKVTPGPLLTTDLKIPYRQAYKVDPGPLLASAIMIGYGAATFHVRPLHDLDLSTKQEIRGEHSQFKTSIDNYLQYSPILGVYALNAMGIHGEHNFKDRTLILGMSSLIVCGSVTAVKTLTHRVRPDGSAANSFPSGHTATAFMSAEFMRMEYRNVSPWYGVAGYMAATATGVLRMYNNRHWLSDVVAGAGVGILSTQAAFWLYPKIQRGIMGKGNTGRMVVPTYDAGTKSVGISLICVR